MRVAAAERDLSPSPRAALRHLLEAAVVAMAWVAAFALRFDVSIPPERIGQLTAGLPLVVLLQLSGLYLAGANRHSWRYTTLPDLVPLLSSVAATGVALALTRAAAPTLSREWPGLEWLTIPYGVIGGYVALATLTLTGSRVLCRVTAERAELRQLRPEGEIRRVLLVGAGRTGVIVAQELQSRPDLGLTPVGFVDDDPVKQGRRISGLDVLGTSTDIERLVKRHGVDDVVISIASVSGSRMRQLIERSELAGRHPLIVPGLSEIVGGKVSLNLFRPVAVEDLLGRDQVELDPDALGELLTGAVVLITGAGGSIGAELARQVAAFAPARLVLVERSEPALWAIDRELEADAPCIDVVAAVADITDTSRMDALLTAHRPSIVLHAAAHKHVPMMEDNPGEAIKNNVLGTRALVDLAVERDVVHLVQISTDKAVNPTSVMGATKRLAERYVQRVATITGRPYVSVRFGNVLGSAGSVVPIFEQQIAAGGPVKVTHPEMRRYFMTIPEASQLVLQAVTLGLGGSVLALDMGEPVKIVDLAKSMIRLSGHEPGEDIAVEYTGLRRGEKLFEELSLTEEGAVATRHPKVWVGRTATPGWDDAEVELAELSSAADRLPPDELRRLLARYVPEFALQTAPETTENRPAQEGASAI